MKYIIIGNSAAAIGAVEGIRQTDQDNEIMIISKEPYHTYSRPLISYLLLGKTDEHRMRYRKDTFYADMKCKTLLGTEVVGILPAQKQVLLENGHVLSYDKLLVSTGSFPFVPPMSGLDTVEKKFTFLSLDDAKKLSVALSPASRVLIIGAGLIGLKCAEGISNRVRDITVVDLAPKILSSILDETGAAIVQKHLENNGVKFILSDSVARFAENTAYLKNGKSVPFDVLVLAVGVRPNISLLKEAGADTNRGVIVNGKMQTSLPDIYAAGDCTESYDVSCDMCRVLALLPSAYMQGECAGINMAGGQHVFDKDMPMNAIGFFGLHIITAGTYEGETYTHETKDHYKKLFYKDDILKGYILIGDVDKAGIYTNLIREKTPLSSIDFKLICEKPSLMAFSKTERKIKLGGVPR